MLDISNDGIVSIDSNGDIYLSDVATNGTAKCGDCFSLDLSHDFDYTTEELSSALADIIHSDGGNYAPRTIIRYQPDRADDAAAADRALLDTGSSMSIFSSTSMFIDLTYFDQPVLVHSAKKGVTFAATAFGAAQFDVLNSTDGRIVTIYCSHALYSPESEMHLINFPDIHHGGHLSYAYDNYRIYLGDYTLSLSRPAGTKLLPIVIRPTRYPDLSSDGPTEKDCDLIQPGLHSRFYPRLPHDLRAALAYNAGSKARADREALAHARAGYPGRRTRAALLRRATTLDYLPDRVPLTRSTGDLLGKSVCAHFPSKRRQVYEHGLIVALDTSGPHPE